MKNIIFDFDGVLLDSFLDQYEWFDKICKKFDKEFHYNTLEEFKRDYLEPVYPDMYNYLGFDWSKDKEFIWEEFHEHKAKNKSYFFTNINLVLKKLHSRDYTLAIASSNTFANITSSLSTNMVDRYFSEIVTKEDLPLENGDAKIKPAPDCIEICLERLGVSAEDAIYVGDHYVDMEAASKVPIQTVAVTYGFCDKDVLDKYNPNYWVDDPLDFLMIFP